jgi:YD repeat-containing protein
VLAIVAAVGIAVIAAAQQPAIFYVYDRLNRLVAVVDQQGNAATYTYDAVGNMRRIERFDTAGQPGAVAISMFTPSAGAPGTRVQVFGKGFGATVAQNALAFNGRRATITDAAPNRLIVTVPNGATTGALSVSTPFGAATSRQLFRVLGDFSISPDVATVRTGAQLAFVALESGAPITSVRWGVNAIPGGDPAFGTIGDDGVYRAPATIPIPAAVTVTATHRDDDSLTAASVVTIVPALNLFIAARPVTIGLAASPLQIDRVVGAGTSVVIAPGGVAAALAGPVSAMTAAPPLVALQAARPVSLQNEPAISELAPSTAGVGGVLTLTVTGHGLATVTTVRFLRNNVVDAAFSVSNLSVSADGTRVTADVAVA